MTTVFLDLDGVMADFEAYFEEHYGFRHDSVEDAAMWKHIDAHESFFGNLPLMKGAKELFEGILDFGNGKLPIILTACPRTNYQRHAIDKINWSHKNLHPDLHVLPVMGGKNKCLFMHKKLDILIDDFSKNIVPWENRGGFGIVHMEPEITIKNLEYYKKHISNRLDP